MNLFGWRTAAIGLLSILLRVEMPAVVPCRSPKVEIPAFATAGLKRSDSLQVKIRALLAERMQRIGYEKK